MVTRTSFRDRLRGRLFTLIQRVVYFANGGQAKPGTFPTFMPWSIEESGQHIPVLVQIDTPFVIDECLALFAGEPAFQYFDPQALEQTLKTLIARAARQSKQLTNDRAIYGFIDEFYKTFGRDVQHYEIAFILNGPGLRRDTLAVGAAVAFTWSQDQAIEWGVKVDQENLDAIVDHPILVVKTSGSSRDVAIELGRQQMESVLDVLRLSIGWGSFVHRIGDATIVDAQPQLPDGGRIREPYLRFAWTGLFVIRPIGEPSEAAVYDYARMQPEWPSLVGDQVWDSTRGLLDQLNQFSNPAGERRYGPEFKRALDWMGSSVTRQRYDEQVVDLCTALECILAKKSDQLKAEAIALRYAVLAKAAGNHYAPLNHLRASYLIRNDVVHGSEKDVARPGHVDTLMKAAIFTLLNVLRLAERVANAPTTSSALIAYLDKQADILNHINEHDLLVAANHPQLDKDICAHYKALADAVPGLMNPVKTIRLPAAPNEFAAAILARSDAQQLIDALLMRRHENSTGEEHGVSTA